MLKIILKHVESDLFLSSKENLYELIYNNNYS